ncbi:MAG TPA: hypothetical protein VH063_08475 [Gaiellaceae bacterium]|nr:hypothetical protein [Gaiellaceae bacterium]
MDDDTRAAIEQISNRLDFLEEHIASMSKWGAQIPFVPMGREDDRPDDPGHIPPEVVDLTHAGKRKEAIVRYRELTGAGAQQAIETIDGLSAS